MPLKHTVTEIALKNGAKGLIIDVPGTTVVSYEVGFRSGNQYVRTKDIQQVAHIMEHMAFGANEKFDSQEAFSQEFTKNGAYNNAYTDSINLVYLADSPLMEWQRILELERLAITTPRYEPDALASEKRNVTEELTGYKNNNYRVLWQKLAQEAGLVRAFDSQNLTTVANVTLDDVKEHFRRTHTLKNMRFIFAGDFQKHQKELVDMLEQWQLPLGERFAIPREKARSAKLVHINRKDVPNLYFDLHLYVNRTLSWGELVAMVTLNHILNDTFHSRIWGAARSKGIAYYRVSSGVDASPGGVSDWEFSSQVGLEHAEELFRLIIDQLEDIAKNGPTEDELQMALEYRLGSLEMAGQTVRSIAGWYDDFYFDRDEVADMDTMEKLVRDVNKVQIQTLTREFLTSGVWTFGGLGNIKKSELQRYYDLFATMLKKAVK